MPAAVKRHDYTKDTELVKALDSGFDPRSAFRSDLGGLAFSERQRIDLSYCSVCKCHPLLVRTYGHSDSVYHFIIM